MNSHDFIGRDRDGSRTDAVERLRRFLCDDAPGYCKVVGTWKVGKTSVFDKAIKESGASRFYVYASDDYVKLSVGGVSRLVAGTGRVRAGLFSLSRLNREIEDKVRPGEVVVFRISISGLEDDHSSLVELCDPEVASPRIRVWSRRKFVLESHEEIEPKWESRSLSNTLVKIVKYKRKEACEYLRTNLGFLLRLDVDGRELIVVETICRYVGYHPELLRRVCEQLHSYGRIFIGERLGTEEERFCETFGKLINDCFTGTSWKTWKEALSSIFKSLSADALTTIRPGDREFHTDVYGAGLVIESEGKQELALIASLLSAAAGLEGWPKRRAFISYSRTDSEFVNTLRTDLGKNGVRVWVDTSEIHPGDRIPERVFEEIAKAEFFLVVLSTTSVASAWVKEELSNALMRANSGNSENRLAIIPLLKEEVEIPKSLSAKSYADFRGKNYEAGFDSLIHKILRGSGSNKGI